MKMENLILYRNLSQNNNFQAQNLNSSRGDQ